MKINRRRFLTTTATAAAAASAPTFLFPRRARAATAGFGRASHLLILNAQGGFRSHCLFNAVGSPQHNPFGSMAAAPGTDWSLGAAAEPDAYATSLGEVPPLPAMSNEIAVLPCVDHQPGERRVDVSHDTAALRMATGSATGSVGLLSIIGKDHPRFVDGFSPEAVPPVEIRGSNFGRGAAEYAATRPLSVQGARASFRAEGEVGSGWKVSAREALNARLRDRRSRAYRSRINEFLLSKAYATTFAELLSDPRIDVTGAPEAEADGVTNAQLLEVLGDHSLRTRGDLTDQRSWGADVAMALRFFSYGSPACVVTRDMYDMHDDEMTNYRPRAGDLGRQLAGLNFVLKRMSHPEGGNYYDRTLVVVVSEFSRNNTLASGFNSGNGSDHVGQDSGPARNQAIAVMGGPVTAGGKLLGSTDAAINATGVVHSSRSLLATCLDAIGIDPNRYWGDAPIGELFE